MLETNRDPQAYRDPTFCEIGTPSPPAANIGTKTTIYEIFRVNEAKTMKIGTLKYK